MKTEFISLYPTIILKVRLPEMQPYNQQLADIVLELTVPGSASKGGTTQAHHVAYQTKPILLERTEECFQQLKHYHELALREYLQTDSYYRKTFPAGEVPEHRTVCWGYAQNEQQIDSYIHHHGASGVSTVYYARCPSNLEYHQGSISFLDPRGAGISSLLGTPAPSEDSFHQPEEGLMILFPSWLQHRPQPMPDSSGWRVSLAMDTNFGFRLGSGFRVIKRN